MPVAALIVVCPAIEVKAIEGHSLHAYGKVDECGAHLPIEAVFVHAEVARGIAEPDESRHERDRRAVMERPSSGGGGCQVLIAYQRPSRTCGTGRSETSGHWVGIINQVRKSVRVGVAENSAKRHLLARTQCSTGA